jgi:hypothetical protein
VICVFGKPEYFCKGGWTSENQQWELICPSGQISTHESRHIRESGCEFISDLILRSTPCARLEGWPRVRPLRPTVVTLAEPVIGLAEGETRGG